VQEKEIAEGDSRGRRRAMPQNALYRPLPARGYLKSQATDKTILLHIEKWCPFSGGVGILHELNE
jgi:hypothetical protein